MNLKLYNTLSKKKEIFKPIQKKEVKFYTCGPTVYDYASIGNMWSYLTADILRRYLEYGGYRVKHVKNITDVGHFTDDEGLSIKGEDKMEKAVKREQKDPLEIANYYKKYYLLDEKKLHIKKPHLQPRPTQEIKKIIEIIEILLEKKFAYETSDGVYFSVNKFPAYGKLSGNTQDKIIAGSRVVINENKKNPTDFALWIKRVGKNKKHILHWNSPWGYGFPGWHIECSAMAIKYLGKSIDIHTGGEDNIFPHHECEIAQSEAYTQKKFSRFWIHTRHFLIDGKKMSKSLGNIFTISQTPDKRYKSLEELGFSPLVFRTLKLGSHYRSKANFTLQSMQQAKINWEKINNFYSKIKALVQKKTEQKSIISLKKLSVNLSLKTFQNDFENAMNNDLNTPKALAVILSLVKEGNTLIKKHQLANPLQVLEFIKKIDSVFAILEKKSQKKPELSKKIQNLISQRNQARKEKDFLKADQIRKTLEKMGYQVVDKKTDHPTQ